MDTRPIRGRLAPSPTGKLHLGNAFAFLSAWASARAQGGKVILRMEDIDPERSRPEYADAIMEDLDWLGIDWDEGPDKGGPHAPYTQSARMERYRDYLNRLECWNLVYPCYCTRKELRMLASAPHRADEGVAYPGTCKGLAPADRERFATAGRSFSLRLDTTAALDCIAGRGGATSCSRKADPCTFTDRILGPQSFTFSQIGGDFPLRRSDGVIAYQLAVAYDDAAMQVSEVVRGADLLSSTPRQRLLQRLMDCTSPAYAHIPLLHDSGGERLAKRHKALELAEIRSKGIPPENVTGFLASLAGWSPAPSAKPEPAALADIVSGFSLRSMVNAPLIVPDTVVEILFAM